MCLASFAQLVWDTPPRGVVAAVCFSYCCGALSFQGRAVWLCVHPVVCFSLLLLHGIPTPSYLSTLPVRDTDGASAIGFLPVLLWSCVNMSLGYTPRSGIAGAQRLGRLTRTMLLKQKEPAAGRAALRVRRDPIHLSPLPLQENLSAARLRALAGPS